MKTKVDRQKAVDCAVRLSEAIAKKGHGEKSLGQLKEVFNINSRVSIHRLIHGDNMPSYALAEKICNALGVSFEWYVLGYGTMDGLLLTEPDEIALNKQYRNQTKAGRRKIMKTAFTQCERHELEPLDAATRQSTLQLVIKKRNGH